MEDREQRLGKRSKRLDAVKIPEGGRYLFDLFWTVRAGASEGFGGLRITWQDLRAFQETSGIDFDTHEVEAIMAMDGAVRAFIAERSAKKK